MKKTWEALSWAVAIVMLLIIAGCEDSSTFQSFDSSPSELR